MKIIAVNGSHKGRGGNTDMMVTAFLKGALTTGAELANVFLAEKDIRYCQACKACWFNNPGQCVIKDDMAKILSLITGADLLVLATPLYVDNISGRLKVFMDRMMVTGSPYWEKDSNGECRHLARIDHPKLLMIANCGYPEKSQFQVISHWIYRMARNLHTDVMAEIYASQGALLTASTAEIQPIIANYLQTLERAGQEIATSMKLTEETKKILEHNFIPDEIYIHKVKQHVDRLLKK